MNSSSTQIWQFSFGQSAYKQLLSIYENESFPQPLFLPKGKASMKTVPEKGDKVIIVCKAEIWFEGTIVSGFDTQRGNELFSLVMLGKKVSPRVKKNGFRRNWINLK
jgi:hypothetical protein